MNLHGDQALSLSLPMPYSISHNKKTCHYMYDDPEGFKE